mmetsp:Transcript_88029/g.235494  ORF Transcript_88029/g.235494 Transcript_88029/m.235494 type:complete len:240 (+) Transcript_88029:235-954(+)
MADGCAQESVLLGLGQGELGLHLLHHLVKLHCLLVAFLRFILCGLAYRLQPLLRFLRRVDCFLRVIQSLLGVGEVGHSLGRGLMDRSGRGGRGLPHRDHHLVVLRGGRVVSCGRRTACRRCAWGRDGGLSWNPCTSASDGRRHRLTLIHTKYRHAHRLPALQLDPGSTRNHALIRALDVHQGLGLIQLLRPRLHRLRLLAALVLGRDLAALAGASCVRVRCSLRRLASNVVRHLCCVAG